TNLWLLALAYRHLIM
ncbi:hypothetical protein CFC21_074016, partial [Triticum aestivum]